MMITALHRFAGVSFAALLLGASGCDGGSPSRTPDEFAADSALAADLALANRDTLLVDSIGAYRPPPGTMPAPDTQSVASAPSASFDDVSGEATSEPGTRGAESPPDPVVPAESPPSPVPAPAPSAAEPATSTSGASAARLSGTRACTSPTRENQSECLRALLPAADARMNRTYRALIAEMRRQEGVRPGGKDPASVQRLRVAQRSWLVYRDTECRKRGRRTEGTRWARPRVRCLGQFANRRANELADDFSKLIAR